MERSSTTEADELDLKELFLNLWTGRVYIIISTLLCLLIAIVYLNITDRKYEVNYTIAPIEQSDQKLNVGGLGGLAALAGINLPSSSNSDFLSYKFLLASEEVAHFVLEDDSIVQAIFKSEWNDDLGKYQAPPKNKIITILSSLKSALTGNSAKLYSPPDDRRLSAWIKKTIDISENKDFGFAELTSKSSDPELIAQLMVRISDFTDELLKKRYIANSEKTMEFYKIQLSKARAREHREALATLIAQEDQKLILASRGSHFVAKPLTAPTISLDPVSPKPSLTLALSVVLGSFLGAAFVLVRKAFKS